jgi:acyl-CoA reductase-like NAD-dependent aldehyde dehydrogenase
MNPANAPGSSPHRRRGRGAGGPLAELETFDTGLPITQARGQARRAAENFRFFADLIVAQFDDAMKVPGSQHQLREPQADRRRRADHPVEHPVHA